MSRFLAFALSMALLSACSGGKPTAGIPTVKLGVRYFQTCGDLQGYIDGQKARWKSLLDSSHSGGFAGSSANTPASSAGSAGSESYVNVQEKGVDEADYFRVGDHHLYFARGQDLVVTDRALLKYLGSLSTSDLHDATMFTDGDDLIVLGNGQASGQVPCRYPGVCSGNGSGSGTVVRFYTATPGAVPTLRTTLSYPTGYVASRYMGGRLFLVFTDSLDVWAGSDSGPTDLSRLTSTVSCGSVLRPAVNDFDFSFTKVLSINEKNPSDVQSTAVLGGAQTLFMTTGHLYLSKSYLTWYGDDGGWDSTIVSKVDLSASDGSLTFSGVGLVPGSVKDQWAFHELDNANGLSVVTTLGRTWRWGAGGSSTSLTVLANQGGILTRQGSVDKLGVGEDVRAVRYIDSMAYVVTFKKTDPLFVIDLSRPYQPQLAGQLVMPGFSMYLHPVAPGRLMGLGYDADDMGSFAWAQGIQLSFFNIQSAASPSRLDNKVFGTRGSYSEVTSDYHAFFADPGTGLVGFPLVEFGGTQYSAGSFGDQLLFAGAALYTYSEDRLTEVGRLSHQRWASADCGSAIAQPRWWMDAGRSIDINRLAIVDGNLMAVSRYGITTQSPANPKVETAATPFPAPSYNDVCPAYYY